MKFSAGLVVILSLAVVLAFAGLLPLGPWHDEYFTLHNYHQQGGSYLFARLLHWGPRPLSEALIYLYGAAIYHTGSPLVGSFVAPFWILLGAAVLLPVLLGRQGLLAACVMLAMLLLGHPVAEVFYWPFGVVAYLPTLTAAALLLALDWGGWIRSRAGAIWMVVALVVAAASSEVGALFTAIYVGLLFISRSLESRRKSLLFLGPLLLSLLVLYIQFTGRIAQGSEVFGDPSLAHHPMKVLVFAGNNLFFELFKGDNKHHVIALISGMLTKLFFLAGTYMAISACHRNEPDQHAQRMRLILALASLATAALILTASLYNFGVPCCERHDTMRQGYVLVALGSLATYLAARWPSRLSRYAGPTLLVALLIPLAFAIPKLTAEYRNYAVMRQVRMANWQSGMAPGPELLIRQMLPGPVTGGLYLTPGIYRRAPGTMDDVHWMLTFFDKNSATVMSPIDSSENAQAPHHDANR